VIIITHKNRPNPVHVEPDVWAKVDAFQRKVVSAKACGEYRTSCIMQFIAYIKGDKSNRMRCIAVCRVRNPEFKGGFEPQGNLWYRL
jgi:hypothetical protein